MTRGRPHHSGWHTRSVLTVLRNGRIYSPAGPDLSVMVVDGDTIVWLGTEDGVSGHLGGAERVIDLDGALVTPAFVDAHAHATATGLALSGLDLAGCASRGDVLDRLAAHVAATRATVVLGGGWDETGWEDRRPPTAHELTRASGGASVYLARVDAHSALVSSDLLAEPGLQHLSGFGPDGWVRRDAHDAVRERAWELLPAGERAAAQVVALTAAARLGIASLHEMAGPTISSAADLSALLALAADTGHPTPEVVGYWGELGAVATARDLGAAGAAGDLFCDGALGSHTAALHAPYFDAADLTGAPRFTVEQIAEHVVACTRAGLQAGFHAIGDAAVDAVLSGIEAAAAVLPAGSVRSAGHRIEHAEMVTAPDRLAASGLIASMQPAFDAAWGGEAGMYAQRLGPDRAAAMNDFNALSGAGVPLAFGSDAPVTPLDPWAAVRAAAYPHVAESAISVRAAFAAHTRGGWRAARRDGDGSGILSVGHPATYAVWQATDLMIDVPDERVARWSTDPRAALAGLPDLSPGVPVPACLRTAVRGAVIHDAGPWCA